MTAETPGLPAESVGSLEVRWIFPGQLEAAVAGWFGRFPARTESREDTYLLDPLLPGLSVKVRGGGALEVKAYRGSPGILEVAGRASGRLESWQKWSFPVSPLRPASGEAAGWRAVRKRRRISRFAPGSGQVVTRAPGAGPEPGCEVELTEVHTSGQDWWTLGFEATGPPACAAANSRLPPRSCSPSPCPAAWNPARTNPGPMASGCASCRAPGMTLMPEGSSLCPGRESNPAGQSRGRDSRHAQRQGAATTRTGRTRGPAFPSPCAGASMAAPKRRPGS